MKTLFSLCIVISLLANVDAQLPEDKMKHFFVGAFISTNTAETVYIITKNKKKSILIGIGAGCLAGAAKELYDSTGRGCPDMRDFIWTCVGSSITSVKLKIRL